MIDKQPVECPVILVDDEVAIVETESVALTINGFSDVYTCTDGPSALALVEKKPASVVVLDITMPKMDGTEVLKQITEHSPETIVVMLTGLNDVETAVSCIKNGAFDYILKPVDQTRLVTSVRKAVEHQMLKREAQRLGEHLLDGSLHRPEAFQHIVTDDDQMNNIFRYVEAIAPTSLPVLVTGETGVGKELFAQSIHKASGRSGTFVCVNTAGIDDALFSDTLFGHEAGAYTGAQKERRGFIEKAVDGTLFLDEIGDMKPESQVKLLRLLQESTYYKLGGEDEERSNARIVAATNRSLEELKSDPLFRQDLFYRLKSHHISIPPLRERPGDVSFLCEQFLREAAEEQGKAKPTVPAELNVILRNYSYPGNVRELRGMVHDAVSRHTGGVLSCEPFKQATGYTKTLSSGHEHAPSEINWPSELPTARSVEVTLVKEALARANGNKKLAAEMIGMARQTFRNKLKELGEG